MAPFFENARTQGSAAASWPSSRCCCLVKMVPFPTGATRRFELRFRLC